MRSLGNKHVLSSGSARRAALAWLAAILLLSACGAGHRPVARTAAYPSCDDTGRTQSMLLAQTLTVSPGPGAMDAGPQTQISLVGVPAGDLSGVRVTGSRSGVHRGRLEPYSQGDGASFIPRRPFAEGEHVSVRLDALIGGRTRELNWSFRVLERAGLGSLAQEALALTPVKTPEQHFVSRPGLNPPVVDVTLDRGDLPSGDLFMAPFGGPEAGPLILDDHGAVVWFHPINVGPRAATKASDFAVQRYEGKPVLTWWEDPLTAPGATRREPKDVVFDQSYKPVATVRGGNGFEAGLHVFVITPQGTALIEGNRDIRCNLAGLGASRTASVWDNVIQEIDIGTGLVRWEWSSLEHVALDEAYDSAAHASADYPFDFFHLNSVQALDRERLLISARNTWAIYEVDRRTGAIDFRVGGKRSSFAMGPGTRTAYQHDAIALSAHGSHGNMLISVFDNGGTPQVHHESRALLERVNLTQHTVRLVRSLSHSPSLLAPSQGSVQVLPGGNVLVGWGQDPWLTEYDAAGQPVFDAHLGSAEQSYRALRFEWEGTPAQPPTARALPAEGGQMAVYASWNGATGVASWRVLAKPPGGEPEVLGSAPSAGFETLITVPDAEASIQVQALDAAGEVIGTTGALTCAGCLE